MPEQVHRIPLRTFVLRSQSAPVATRRRLTGDFELHRTRVHCMPDLRAVERGWTECIALVERAELDVSPAVLPSSNLCQLLFRLTTKTTRPTTTATSRIGTQAPPYPPIQPLFHMLLFIMYPEWAAATPVVNRGTLPTATASKFSSTFPKNEGNQRTTLDHGRPIEAASRQPLQANCADRPSNSVRRRTLNRYRRCHPA